MLRLTIGGAEMLTPSKAKALGILLILQVLIDQQDNLMVTSLVVLLMTTT
jgi:hypothetical protein